jgi:hypothetical protein
MRVHAAGAAAPMACVRNVGESFCANRISVKSRLRSHSIQLTGASEKIRDVIVGMNNYVSNSLEDYMDDNMFTAQPETFEELLIRLIVLQRRPESE